MAKKTSILTIVGLILSAAPVVFGHHSFAAEYDINKKATMTGVISKIEWTNPHTYYYLDVTEPDGKVVTWALEGFPPSSLTRIGWKRDTIKVGDKVTVVAFLAHNGSHRANGREYTLPDGRKLLAGASQASATGGQ